MRLTIDILIMLSCILSFVNSLESYLYEKQNFYGLSRRLIPNPQHFVIKGGEYPEPLPTPKPSQKVNPPTPYRSLYQGMRIKNDTRVFRRKFEYPARLKGHQVRCDGMFDCIISFLAVESTEAIPVILRGGAGYRHFSTIIKAKPGRELKGQVRAYCRNQAEQVPAMRSWKNFKFEDVNNASD